MSDLISRQAAIDAVEQYYKDKKYIARSRTILSAICQDIKNVIDSLQSAQPRMRGKWIEVDDAYNRISGRCSACGWEAHMYEDDVVGMPFCPSCGADMREGVQDELHSSDGQAD